MELQEDRRVDGGNNSGSISPLLPSETSPLDQETTSCRPFLVPGRKQTSRLTWLPRRRRVKQAMWLVLTTTFLASLAVLTWLAVILTVTNRLRIPQPQNGLQQILQKYQAPTTVQPATPTWLDDFSASVAPVQCHSHNDYLHRVPLYEGLSVGCSSTEADIWARKSTDGHIDLFIGHSVQSLRDSRTLRSLYLDPLFDILTHQNLIPPNSSINGTTQVTTPPVGVFDTAPTASFALLLDFKTGDNATWDTVVTQLDGFRARDWLTYWTPETGVVGRPLIIIASGAAPYDSVIRNTTYRDVFYDAPLTNLEDLNATYTSNNSYYASASLRDAVGKVWFGTIRASQKVQITKQVDQADQLGLRSRYWDTPGWPVGWRNRIWDALVAQGVSVLNVDDLTAAARWDWQMCVVAGINVCAS